MKILSILTLSIIASGALFAADFSKSSNADLLNMAGKVKAEEARDYFAEIDKRVDEMTGKEAREFWEKYRANEEKVFDNMKVKDIRAYKQSLGGARGGKPCPLGLGRGGYGQGYGAGLGKGQGRGAGMGKGQGPKAGQGRGQGRGMGNCGANCPNLPATNAQ